MHPNIPAEIISELLKPLGVVEVQSVPPGMSGSRVFHCRTADRQQLAVKRWPAGTEPTRVRQVHQIVAHCRAGGVDTVAVPRVIGPQRQSVFVAGGGCWEAASWMPGTPLPEDAPLERIGAGARQLARFHAATASLGCWSQSPPAVQSRLDRIDHLRRQLRQLPAPSEYARFPGDIHWEGRGELLACVQSAGRFLQGKWDEVRSEMTRSLSRYVACNVTTQWVLRDVHREHMLFQDEDPSGLIDFDAVRVDTPIADLSRWIGSFLAGRDDPEAVWQAGLADYREERSFSSWPARNEVEWEFNQALAKDLLFATTWISLANWLLWLVCERRQFPASDAAVAARLAYLQRLAEQSG